MIKKINTMLKKIFSNKKTINHHQDSLAKANIKNDIKDQWSKRMNSTHNKISEGASERAASIRSHGGSNSKISGREHDKGHKQANTMHTINKKK